jgi:hypothetical protein
VSTLTLELAQKGEDLGLAREHAAAAQRKAEQALEQCRSLEEELRVTKVRNGFWFVEFVKLHHVCRSKSL